MHNKIEIILGPPGTGKTENLLRIVDRELKNGTPPDRIAFVSFTKKAAQEAIDRAKIKFNLTDDDFPYFSTLHAFGKRNTGMSKSEVMSKADMKEFSKNYGIDLTTSYNADYGAVLTDNKFMNDINKSKMQDLELQDFYNNNYFDYSWRELLLVYQSYEEYKQEKGKFDFNDMLIQFVNFGHTPKLDVVIVDEAQDLSKLQWRMCRKIWENSERVYISGDDDQAIFRWMGADVDELINMEGNVTVLKQSYRCPQLVHNMAGDIVKRIRNRRPKEWKAREEKGFVQYHEHAGYVDMDEGNWLALATCGYMLDELQVDLRNLGLAYTIDDKFPVSENLLKAVNAWKKLLDSDLITHEEVMAIYSNLKVGVGVERGYKGGKTLDENQKYNVEELSMHHGLLNVDRSWDETFKEVMGDEDRYYLQALDVTGQLDTKPRINLSTIHKSKGGECDNVILVTDLSRANQDEMEVDSDDTNRVFYVGVTRAKQSLHIINPQKERGFIL
tara:strand:- start:436 stop:1935 length:1500 start_codon:yes stop_codon:yes gene_type:complete